MKKPNKEKPEQVFANPTGDLAIADILDIEAAAWCPDSAMLPTRVAVLGRGVDTDGRARIFALYFKSAVRLDALIDALLERRRQVFGPRSQGVE